MRVSAYISETDIRFSKGRKHFIIKGNQNTADLTSKKWASVRNKYLLHPELYEEKMMRIRPQKHTKGMDFEAGVQGASGNV